MNITAITSRMIRMINLPRKLIIVTPL